MATLAAPLAAPLATPLAATLAATLAAAIKELEEWLAAEPVAVTMAAVGTGRRKAYN